jgi:hypothetical protein
VTESELKALLNGIAPELKKYLNEWLGALESRIAELEHQNAECVHEIAALKHREAALKYVGVWSSSTPYHVGNFVTDHGDIWHCDADSTGQRPGSSACWTLACKKGRDARERVQ